jgi:2,4-dienoyl-CoA reductase-like NADH-dependent reductase (Old Yellow Enzyme family)
MPALSDDRYLGGMRHLAALVHRHGARVAAQLNYMGTYSFVDVMNGHGRGACHAGSAVHGTGSGSRLQGR